MIRFKAPRGSSGCPTVTKTELFDGGRGVVDSAATVLIDWVGGGRAVRNPVGRLVRFTGWLSFDEFTRFDIDDVHKQETWHRQMIWLLLRDRMKSAHKPAISIFSDLILS